MADGMLYADINELMDERASLVVAAPDKGPVLVGGYKRKTAVSSSDTHAPYLAINHGIVYSSIKPPTCTPHPTLALASAPVRHSPNQKILGQYQNLPVLGEHAFEVGLEHFPTACCTHPHFWEIFMPILRVCISTTSSMQSDTEGLGNAPGLASW